MLYLDYLAKLSSIAFTIICETIIEDSAPGQAYTSETFRSGMPETDTRGNDRPLIVVPSPGKTHIVSSSISP